MQLGALLEELTVARARAGIEKLVHLTPRTARVLRDGGEEIIPAEQVQIGDRIRVLPGESIPVDGVILSGQTSINQAVMTGESLPVDKSAGDAVSSGTVNQFGAFEMEAARVGEDSSIQRMIRLVQSADAGKAKIVGLADRWATWIVVIALTAAALTWLITGQIIRAVTILVVFCPCALVLATPTAIMAAIGNATKHGFLVREGDALERLATAQDHRLRQDRHADLRHPGGGGGAAAFCRDFAETKLYACWPPRRSSSPSIRWARPSSAAAAGKRRRAACGGEFSDDPRPRRCGSRGGADRSGREPRAACESTAYLLPVRCCAEAEALDPAGAAPSSMWPWTGRLAGFPRPVRHAAGRKARRPLPPCTDWAFSRCCSPAITKAAAKTIAAQLHIDAGACQLPAGG